jgi:hypothetical protein
MCSAISASSARGNAHWSFGLLVFWSRVASVYTWSADFNRRSSSLLSTRANKFALHGSRALLHSISILRNKTLRSPRPLREAPSAISAAASGHPLRSPTKKPGHSSQLFPGSIFFERIFRLISQPRLLRMYFFNLMYGL